MHAWLHWGGTYSEYSINMRVLQAYKLPRLLLSSIESIVPRPLLNLVANACSHNTNRILVLLWKRRNSTNEIRPHNSSNWFSTPGAAFRNGGGRWLSSTWSSSVERKCCSDIGCDFDGWYHDDDDRKAKSANAISRYVGANGGNHPESHPGAIDGMSTTNEFVTD